MMAMWMGMYGCQRCVEVASLLVSLCRVWSIFFITSQPLHSTWCKCELFNPGLDFPRYILSQSTFFRYNKHQRERRGKKSLFPSLFVSFLLQIRSNFQLAKDYICVTRHRGEIESNEVKRR